jgi:glycosyltransferase involved in cell wall biosynthesis
MNTIAFPTSTFLPGLGGVEVGLHNIASRVRKKGYRTIVIIPFSNYLELKPELHNFTYEIIPFPPKTWWLVQNYPSIGFKFIELFFSRLQKKYKFDFWHCTVGYPLGVGLIKFSRKYGELPYLIRCAGEDIQLMPEINYGMRTNKHVDNLVRKYFPEANLLVGITNSVIEEYRALGVSEEKIRYVPNGVEIKRFKKNVDKKIVRKKFNINDNEFLFLTVGRNHTKKNFKLIIDALKIIKNDGLIKCKVLFVGKNVSELKYYASECLVDEYVVFSEQAFDIEIDQFKLPAEELIDIYLSADTFICPSLIETFGIVIVEAMAAGLPVITTNAAGCRDLVRNGNDGVMVDKNSPSELASAMKMFIGNQDIKDEYSTKSQERVQEFNWDLIVDNYSNIYIEEINKYASNNISA